MPLYSCYLFYNWDVFDLFLLCMSVEKIEIFVERERPPCRLLHKSALTSRPTASQTRFSLGSEAPVSAEGRRSPTMEENRTPSLFNCSLLLRFRKVGSESLISGSLCPRCSGNAEGDARSQEPVRFYLLSDDRDAGRGEKYRRPIIWFRILYNQLC